MNKLAKKNKKASNKSVNNVEDGKACALLSYLLIGIIWYFVDEKMKSNDFVKFHVKQGLVLLIASIIYSIALGIVFQILFFPLMMGMMFGLLAIFRLLYYVPLVWTVLGIINAVNGQEKELPVIGHYSSKFTF